MDQFCHLFQHVSAGRYSDITVFGCKEKGGDDNSIVTILLLYRLHQGPKCKNDVRSCIRGGDIVMTASDDNVHWFSDVHVLLEEGGVHIMDLASDDAVKVDVEAGLVGGLRPDVVQGGGANHHLPPPLLFLLCMLVPANGAGVTFFLTFILGSLSYAV